MKILSITVFFMFLTFFAIPEEVKIVRLAENLPCEKSGFKETLLRNLCEQGEIYQAVDMLVFKEYIYILNWKPVGIYKFDLQGKRIAKSGRRGQGPGEFIYPGNIKIFKGYIIFLEFNKKILFFNLELDFIKEVKLSLHFGDFIINNESQIIYPVKKLSANVTYFSVYSEEWEKIRGFGEPKTEYDPQKYSYDYAARLAYDSEKDGIWAAFGDRYDLAYYEKDKLKVELKEKKNFFKKFQEKDKYSGSTILKSTGQPIELVVLKDRLYYFYRIDKEFYCDIFNKNSFKLLRRIKLDRFYRRIAHYKRGIFYAIYRGFENEEDNQLYRLELK